MEELKILNIEKVSQKQLYFCWAASIEMTYRFVSDFPVSDDFQSKLCLVKNSTEIGGTNSTMESNEENYNALFNHDILNKIGCSQIQSTTFPSIDEINDKLLNNQPFIISNLNYILITGNKHALILEGFYWSKDIYWILMLDPINAQDGTFKTAWIYTKIIEFHNNRNENKKSKLDFITNFNDQIEENNTFQSCNFSSNLENLKEYDIQESTESIAQLANEIIKSNCKMISAYFNLNCTLKWSLTEYYNYRPVEAEYVLKGEWLGDAHSGATLYLPIWQNGNTIFEMIFQEYRKNKVSFFGIQEAKGIQEINVLYHENEQKKVEYILTHEQPNFEILCITPMNYLFFEITHLGKPLLAPLNNYGSLQKVRLYSQEDIQSFLKIIKY